MVRWNFHSMAECPHCKFLLEDKHHIIWCPDPSAVQLWHSSLECLWQWLRQEHTDHLLVKVIIEGLRWYNGNTEAPVNLFLLTQDQNNIGWDYLFDGWISQTWQEYHARIWKTCCSQKLSY